MTHLPPGLMQANAILTLKVAEEGDRVIMVHEDLATVTKMVNDSDERLVIFTRIMGMKPRLFSTRPDNVANVRENI